MAFEVGLALGGALHSGRYPSVGAAVPATIEAGLRWPAFEIGAYGAYAPIFAGRCSGDCPEGSANLKRTGFLVRLITEGEIRPWFGAQFGMSWVNTRQVYSATPSQPAVTFETGSNGFDVGGGVGLDATLAHAFAFGPYFLVDHIFGWNNSDSNTPGMTWYSLGLRSEFDFEL